MIVTVTLNPAIDVTAGVGILRVGSLNRLSDVVADIGGKGVNVSRTIAALGGRSIATGFAGGGAGAEIIRQLAASEGIMPHFVPIAGSTRTNLKVIDHGGQLTELNQPGPEIASGEISLLEGILTEASAQGAVVVIAGSAAPGLGEGYQAHLVRLVRQSGGIAVVDADGPALRAAIEERPALVKPNRHEITQLFGAREDASRDEVTGLVAELLASGVERVVCSLGPTGALFGSSEGIIDFDGLVVPVASTVGAGDAMTAVLAMGLESGAEWGETARLAMAAATAAVMTAGTRPPQRSDVDALVNRFAPRDDV
ncbi:MAG: hexose kinase [Propionibacteriaceae bacterium]|jgi:1-phosphofructokinase|nr:hexose kinase [Propionibacteriaceae bacterium]